MDTLENELKALQSMLKEPLTPLVPNQPKAVMLEHPAFADLLDPRGLLFDGLAARHVHIAEYGFVVLTRETVQALARFIGARKCLDAAAGTGWLSHVLAQEGVNVTASDLGGESPGRYRMRKVWRRDHEGDSLQLLPGDYEVVILCWPPYQRSFGYDVISRMKPGQVLIFQGESAGGCTADDAFFAQLEDETLWSKDEAATQQLNQDHLRFATVHDRWSVWRKL